MTEIFSARAEKISVLVKKLQPLLSGIRKDSGFCWNWGLLDGYTNYEAVYRDTCHLPIDK
jgi:hypothetical protein